MTILILFLLLLFTGLTFLCYFIVKSFFENINKWTKSNLLTNKKIIFTISFLMAGLIIYFYLFTTPTTNYKNAFIEIYQQDYKVTVKGKRVSMVHDPIAALLRKTYEDSIFFIIPRNNGVIKGNEIQVSQGGYKLTGKIIINDQKINIELYDDEEQTDPDSWNGTYSLNSR